MLLCHGIFYFGIKFRKKINGINTKLNLRLQLLPKLELQFCALKVRKLHLKNRSATESNNYNFFEN